jgi:hypothetical protein
MQINGMAWRTVRGQKGNTINLTIINHPFSWRDIKAVRPGVDLIVRTYIHTSGIG